MINFVEMAMQGEGQEEADVDVSASAQMSMVQHVRRWQSSQMSKRQYTQVHGLNYWSFRATCKRLGAISKRAPRESGQGAGAQAVPMVEIPLRRAGEESIELELTNGMRVHLRGTRAGMVMEKLLRALS